MRTILTTLTACLALLAGLLLAPPSGHADVQVGPRYAGVVTAPTDPALFPSVPVGATSLMGTSYWLDLEPRPGEWNFDTLDAQVANARAHGAKPMLILGLTPRFHSSRPRASDYRTAMPALWAWRRYVRTVATRYGSTIDYQVWPEPNITSNWTGTTRQMAILQRAAFQEINKVESSAVVAGPATVLRLKGQQEWARSFYSQRLDGVGVGRYLDVIALDPYPLTAGRPEDSMKLVDLGRRIAAQAGNVRKPTWTVEINYGIPSGGTGAPPRYTDLKQIAYVLRTYALSAGHGVSRVYWLSWHYNPGFPINLTEPGSTTVSPAGRAFSRVRTWMLKYRHRGCSVSSGVYRCTLTGRTGGRAETRTILWRLSGTSSWRAPAGSFQLWKGTGPQVSIRRGYAVKVTSVPVMVRQH